MKALRQETIGYINAGGRGTRLNGIFTPDPEKGIAKALLEIGSPPVKLIEHHVTCLLEQGLTRIVVAAGDQPEVVEYVQDSFDARHVTATSSINQQGTGGDLVSYVRTIDREFDVVVQNVDTILDIDIAAFTESFSAPKHMGAVACIALTRSPGVPNENAYSVNGAGMVLHSAEFADPSNVVQIASDQYRASSTGSVILDSEFLRTNSWLPADGQLSIYSNILRDAWNQQRLYAHDNGTRFFRDIGTVATWLNSVSDPFLHTLLNRRNIQAPIELHQAEAQEVS